MVRPFKCSNISLIPSSPTRKHSMDIKLQALCRLGSLGKKPEINASYEFPKHCLNSQDKLIAHQKTHTYQGLWTCDSSLPGKSENNYLPCGASSSDSLVMCVQESRDALVCILG